MATGLKRFKMSREEVLKVIFKIAYYHPNNIVVKMVA